MATKELAAFEPTNETIELLKNTLTSAGTDLTDSELKLFLYQAKRSGLDPLARQIYVTKSGSKITCMTSIDGQRLVAQRTGQYEGQVGPQWCGKDGQWRDVWLEDEHPAAARIGVYRTNFKEPTYGVATWKSYAKFVDEWVNGKKTGNKVLSSTWGQIGDVMLAKCAESQALRKAFPQELADLYTAEEMDQAQPEPIQAEVIQNPPATQQQVRGIFATLKGKGVKDKDQAKNIIYEFGDVDSVTKLTYEQANEVSIKIDEATPELLATFFVEPTEAEVAEAFEGQK